MARMWLVYSSNQTIIMSNAASSKSETFSKLPTRWLIVAVALLVLLFAQGIGTAKRDSVSWDESQHLYSGWLAWKQADFGFNPEVPPLIKMWLALPLLHRQILQPPYTGDPFKKEGFVLGQRFLASNGIDRTLFPARIMAVVLTLLLAAMLFLAGWEMFGAGPAVFALALFTFDPNFLAHGSFVTTDIGASLTTLMSVYAFYRFVKRPSWLRMLLLGVAVGLAMIAKFTGVLIMPILVVIACLELWGRRADRAAGLPSVSIGRMLTGLIIVGAIGIFSVWAIYGFRYQARPGSLVLNPPTSAYLQELTSPLSRGVMTAAARHHLLPEAYLYGLADTKISASELPSYFFGRTYAHAPRFYFPAALLIKSTLPFLILLVLALVRVASGRWKARREIVFLTIPSAIFFLVATFSDIGIGYRHLFPIFPLLYILIAGAAGNYMEQSPRWRFVFGVLLLWQIITAIASYPARLAYANEAWGGSSRTHLYLSDSNTDWGQQLKMVKAYLEKHPDRPCYFAYFAQGPVDFRDYGISCQPLPTASGSWTGLEAMHFGSDPAVSGIVLISDGVLAGLDHPGKLNPYEKFRLLQPVAVIDHGVYVYDGTFSLPQAASLDHVERAQNLLRQNRFSEALEEAQMAVRLAPDSAIALSTLGDSLAGLNRMDEARAAYTAALHAAQTIDPEFQERLIAVLRLKAAGKQP